MSQFTKKDSSKSDAISAAKKSCGQIPDGGIEEQQFYSVSKIYGGQNCEKYRITLHRTCHNGTFGAWEGYPKYFSTCEVDNSIQGCNEGEQETKTLYKAAQVPWDQKCAGKKFTRECKPKAMFTDEDGQEVVWTYDSWEDITTNSGYWAESCVVLQKPAPCKSPDGKSIEHGDKISYTYYTQNASTPGKPCKTETAIGECVDGVIKYTPDLPQKTFSFCDEGKPYQGCTYQDKTYAHNDIVETRERFADPIGDTINKCKSEKQYRYCQDGSISPKYSGTYRYPECFSLPAGTTALSTKDISDSLFPAVGHGTYACGDTVFLLTYNHRPSKYAPSTTNKYTEEMYYFKMVNSNTTNEKIKKLSADDLDPSWSQQNVKLFSTESDFYRKGFRNLFCIDNRYLAFSLIYQTSIFKSGNEWHAKESESIFLFDTKKTSTSGQKVLVVKDGQEAFDLFSEDAYLRQKESIQSYISDSLFNLRYLNFQSDIFTYIKTKNSNNKNQYVVTFSYLNNNNADYFLREKNPSVAAFKFSENDTQAILSHKGFNKQKWENRTFHSDCEPSDYGHTTAGVLPESGQILYLHSIKYSCHSPRANLTQNYVPQVCKNSGTNLTCEIPQNFVIPEKYLKENIVHNSAYLLHDTDARFINLNNKLYLLLADKKTILQVAYDQNGYTFKEITPTLSDFSYSMDDVFYQLLHQPLLKRSDLIAVGFRPSDMRIYPDTEDLSIITSTNINELKMFHPVYSKFDDYPYLFDKNWNMSYSDSTNIVAIDTYDPNHLNVINLNKEKSERIDLFTQTSGNFFYYIVGTPVIVGDYIYAMGYTHAIYDGNDRIAGVGKIFKVPLKRFL